MRQAATQELYSYWNRLRGERLSPERAEIDPSAIRHILADTMILEVDEERQFPVRISGSRLNALFLEEQKGHSFVSLFAPDERAAASELISAVVDGVRPIVAGLVAEVDGDRSAMLEWLLLPLRDHGKTHARVLGMLTPTFIPSWLGLRRANHLRVLAMRFVGEEQAAALSLQPAREDDSLRPAHIAQRAKTRRRSFFVIPGGREG